MTMLVTAQGLYVLLGLGLIGVGLSVLIHPDPGCGGSLMLLGVAALERGSARVRRAFALISSRLAVSRLCL